MMAHNFTPYPSISAVRSQLLTNPPAAVPPIEDLISLSEELKNLKNKSLARGTKAENELRILEGLVRKNKDKDKDRDKDKDKGKSKERVIRVKHEATETPDSHISTTPSSIPASVATGGHGVKALPGSKSGPSKTFPKKSLPDARSFASASSSSGPVSKDKLKKEKDRSTASEKEKRKDLKKKKRKRENDDSDLDEFERPKKPKRSPEPPNHKQKSPSKVNHLPSTLHTPHSTPIASFAIPRHVRHIPQPPISSTLPVPGPSHPKQVTEDFSKLKVPQQTTISTFWTYVEPWLRPIREEDVGLLEWDGDEETPFIVPPLGRHYTEIWEDEDNGRYFQAISGASNSTPSTASLPKWDPLTIQDSDLTNHDKGHFLGPVHERLLSAMITVPVLADGRPASTGGSKAGGQSEVKVINPATVDEKIGKLKPFEGDKQPPKVNIQDMQDRLIKELRSIGLLGEEEPNYAKSADDPLAAELRLCQRMLRKQITVNKARRRRLCEIAKSRLARNEFEEHLGALERSIYAKYNQLQRRDMPKPAKKKKKSGGAGGGAHIVPDGPFVPPPHIHPASWGMERDEECVLGVDEELNNMIRIRQQFVDVVQPCLDAKQRERPGCMYGSPAESIYKGVEEVELKVKDG